MFSKRMAVFWNLLTMRFHVSLRPEKGVCYLKDFARIWVTVDALPFGQIWFRSVIRIWITGVLTVRAKEKHLSSSPCIHI